MRCGLAYRVALIVGVAVGLINLLLAMFESAASGDGSIAEPWHVLTLIVTFPTGLLCGWLLSRRRQDLR